MTSRNRPLDRWRAVTPWCRCARGGIRTLTLRRAEGGSSPRPTVTTGVAQAELVVPSRPFLASIAAFVTARALDCEGFRVARDYFRDYSRPASNLQGPASTGAADHGVAFALELRDRPVLREVLPDSDDEIRSHSGRELLQCLKRRARTTAFHAGDGRLGGAHAVGQFGLGQPGVTAESVDELPEGRDSRLIRRSAARPRAGRSTWN